jgi:hypothetical protein
MPKLKKLKSGKIKRHRFRKAIGVKNGFGKPWSAPSVTFRVEFSWENADGSEENEQVHWIECRKFQGEEREFLKAHYTQSTEEWTEGETLESKFVCVYCAGFLVKQMKALGSRFEPMMFNQAFVFPTPKKGNETIRFPIYQIKWTEELAKNSVFNSSIEIVMKNSIWHKQSENY